MTMMPRATGGKPFSAATQVGRRTEQEFYARQNDDERAVGRESGGLFALIYESIIRRRRSPAAAAACAWHAARGSSALHASVSVIQMSTAFGHIRRGDCAVCHQDSSCS